MFQEEKIAWASRFVRGGVEARGVGVFCG